MSMELPLLNSLAVKPGVKVHHHYFFVLLSSPEAGSCVGKAHRSTRAYIYMDYFLPANLHPASPALRRQLPSSLCALPESSRSSQVSPATGAPVWPAGLGTIGPWTQAPQAPPESWKPWYCRHEDNGAAGWKHSSLPHSVGRGVWWGGKVVNADALCFPKPAFLANSCVYTKLSRRGSEGKDSVLGMTSFCLVCFRLPPLPAGGGCAGKVAGAGGLDIYGVKTCRVFMRMHLLEI